MKQLITSVFPSKCLGRTPLPSISTFLLLYCSKARGSCTRIFKSSLCRLLLMGSSITSLLECETTPCTAQVFLLLPVKNLFTLSTECDYFRSPNMWVCATGSKYFQPFLLYHNKLNNDSHLSTYYSEKKTVFCFIQMQIVRLYFS